MVIVGFTLIAGLALGAFGAVLLPIVWFWYAVRPQRAPWEGESVPMPSRTEALRTIDAGNAFLNAPHSEKKLLAILKDDPDQLLFRVASEMPEVGLRVWYRIYRYDGTFIGNIAYNRGKLSCACGPEVTLH